MVWRYGKEGAQNKIGNNRVVKRETHVLISKSNRAISVYVLLWMWTERGDATLCVPHTPYTTVLPPSVLYCTHTHTHTECAATTNNWRRVVHTKSRFVPCKMRNYIISFHFEYSNKFIQFRLTPHFTFAVSFCTITCTFRVVSTECYSDFIRFI